MLEVCISEPLLQDRAEGDAACISLQNELIVGVWKPNDPRFGQECLERLETFDQGRCPFDEFRLLILCTAGR